MNAALPPPAWFQGLPATAPQHFALHFFSALLVLLQPLLAAAGSAAALRERLPFLGGYLDELEATLQGLPAAEALPAWRAALGAWEATAPAGLPLRRLMARHGLASSELTLLLLCGLVEEDPRLGALWALLQGEGHEALEPALASSLDLDTPAPPRATLARLQALGLVQPAGARGWQAWPALWPLLRGDEPAAVPDPSLPWCWHPAATAPGLDELELPDGVHAAAAALARAWQAAGPRPLALRGRPGSGRRSLLRAVARAAGLGVVEARPAAPAAAAPAPARLAIVALLAGGVAMLRADAAARPQAFSAHSAADPAPDPAADRAADRAGEAAADLAGDQATAASAGAALADALAQGDTIALLLPPAAAVPAGCAVIELPMPTPAVRERLWRRVLAAPRAEAVDMAPAEIDAWASAAARHRLPAATLVSVARAARHGDACVPGPERVRQALAARHGAGLGRLARRELLAPGLDTRVLALPPATRADWQALLARCRHREALAAAAGPALAGLGPGVRALFKGPSGTGKTLAARVLAAELGMALYRIDLGAVVDKYIGETEKHLEQVFSAAETLDAMLLLDEGDALLAPRTGVASATDRYANLETNYLLQRLEAFEGVLVVTSNAAERIDTAFLRRLDAVLEFPLPAVAERLLLWRLHLPTTHTVPEPQLQRLAQRGVLAGGQIRHVALHAALLSLERGTALGPAELQAALLREYRRAGQALPPGLLEPA
jgi:hypothetical protein